jgi:uncharacterized protein YukE
MIDQLHKELVELQTELARLGKAVDHIDKAKLLATSLVENGEGLQARYNSLIAEVQELTNTYQGLIGKTEKLIHLVDDIDFPTRLDKLDISVTTVNQGMQNVQSKLENQGTLIRDEFKETKSTLVNKFRESELLSEGEFKHIKILLYASLLLGLGAIAVEFLPK